MGVAMAIACVASDASGGLQSAMATALSGLRASETTIGLTPASQRLPYFWDLGPVPDGTLFVDPVSSTHGAAAYADGPQLTYDPSTGAASLFAPPMLSPADEFGIRSYHSPRSVTLLFGESRVASPELPRLTSFERRLLSGVSEEASFGANDYGPAGFELAMGGTHAVADVLTISTFGGFRLDFPRLLEPGLDAATFAVPMPPTPQPGELIVMSISAPLPAVGAIVEYGYSLGSLGAYFGGPSVLAKVILLPEPTTGAIGLWAVIFVGMMRRRS